MSLTLCQCKVYRTVRGVCRVPDPHSSSELSRSSKTGKVWENVTVKRSLRRSDKWMCCGVLDDIWGWKKASSKKNVQLLLCELLNIWKPWIFIQSLLKMLYFWNTPCQRLSGKNQRSVKKDVLNGFDFLLYVNVDPGPQLCTPSADKHVRDTSNAEHKPISLKEEDIRYFFNLLWLGAIWIGI